MVVLSVIGSQRPNDADLADELLRDLDRTTEKGGATNDSITQLDLHLTEDVTRDETSTVLPITKQLNPKASTSDGGDSVLEETMQTANKPFQNTEDLNLELSESENMETKIEENTGNLYLHVSQSEKTDNEGFNVDPEPKRPKDMTIDTEKDGRCKEQLVNGHNSSIDDSILSENSDKGLELKLKLSVSDSDNIEVDE